MHMFTELLGNDILMTMFGYLKSVWYIFLVLIGFGFIIFVHELGHFLAARIVGIKVETFAIGFGPRLFGFRRGDTDYRISLLPFGGYVKMLGQEDFTVDHERLEKTKIDPASFLAKTPGQRMFVVSGGVFMNLIFAALGFVVVFMHGMEFPAPVAGDIIPNSPAERAGFMPGDRILAIDGKKVLNFNEIMLAVALSDPDRALDFEIERNGKVLHKKVRPVYNPESQLRQIGIAGAGSLKVWGDSGGLKDGDIIVKVGNIKPKLFSDVERVIKQARGRPVVLVVERKEGDKVKRVSVIKRAHLVLYAELVSFPPKAEDSEKSQELAKYKEPSILGLVPRRKFIGDIELKDSKNDSPVIQKGDVIIRVGNILNPTGGQIQEYLEKLRGKKARLEVLRKGKRIEVVLPVPKSDFEFTYVFGQMIFDEDNTVVADVLKNTPAEKLKIPKGAKIIACDGRKVESWFDVIDCFKGHEGKSVELTWLAGETKQSGKMKIPEGSKWLGRIDYTIDFFTYPLTTKIVGKYPHQAIALGLRQTWYIIKMAYVTIQRVAFTHTIGAKQISGPIFIIHKGKEIAESGFYKLIYYLALISANLAVINFLPIPAVDGGLILILLVEKIRGKGLSPKITAIWQAIGISLLIALLLFVTYNDISRLIQGQ